MKNHCVSLELAKQLVENGWNNHTEFWWCEIEKNKFKLLSEKYRPHPSMDRCCPIPAPLATEILEELPRENINIAYANNLWYAAFTDGLGKDNRIPDKTLPNALAKMWLYLKKEGLLK